MEAHYLNSLEKTAVSPDGSFSEMERQMYLDIINDLREIELNRRKEFSGLNARIEEMGLKLDSLESENAALRSELAKTSREKSDVSQANELNKQTLYGSKTQKGTKVVNNRGKSRDEERDDFDGTPSSLSDEVPGDEAAGSASSGSISSLNESAVSRKAVRPESYVTMDAAREVIYECDLSSLPKDKKFICFKEVEEYERVAYIQKNLYRVAVLEDEYGVRGELIRMCNEKMSICRQTIGNWFQKGADFLKELLPYLKGELLKNMSFIHSDETWCRVRIELPQIVGKFKYVKRYIWVLVNEATKVVYYLYDNGSRGGQVIRNFLGGFKGSLQTDAYAAYRFFDKEEVGIEHIICMAHVRAKFKYAQTTGQDSRADYFLERIGALYGIELENRLFRRNPEEVLKMRQTRGREILGDIQQRAKQLLDDPIAHYGKLMKTALNYMMNN